jgi:hypothetical protein
LITTERFASHNSLQPTILLFLWRGNSTAEPVLQKTPKEDYPTLNLQLVGQLLAYRDTNANPRARDVAKKFGTQTSNVLDRANAGAL